MKTPGTRPDEKQQVDDPVTSEVLGSAIRVHRQLGPGFLESIYHRALEIKLAKNDMLSKLGIHSHHRIDVHYDNEVVGQFEADFLIGSEVLIEIKATAQLHDSHEVQLVNYLAATRIETGLLLNFGEPVLKIKRKYRTFRKDSASEPSFS